MKGLAVLVLFFTECLLGGAIPEGSRDEVCGTKPADIIFVLDSSSSILFADFRRQLKFVTDVVSHFTIGPNSIQVGAVSFSNWAQPEFFLNDFDNENDVRTAIRNVIQMKGDTNTASALAFVQDVMLTSERGARPDVPHVIVVLTDGKSDDPEQTAQQAFRAKKHADVHVFAIGVGSLADQHELTRIASDPTDQYVFTVKSYAALETIKDLLAIKACQVTNPPLPPTTTADPSIQVDQACGLGVASDVLFAASASADAKGTVKSIEFFKNISSRLDIGPGKVRVGLVPKDCDTLPEMHLQDFSKKQLRQLKKRSLPSTSSVLRYINELGYVPSNEVREHVKKSSLIIIDCPLNEADDAIVEAIRAKQENNIELFVVGVGKGVSTDDLKGIASSPADTHVFHVTDYDELTSIAEKVSTSICPVPSLL